MDPIKVSPAHLARYGFADNERSAAALGPEGLRLWDPATRRPADDDAAAVLDTLYFAADPDLALFQLHRLVEAAGEEVRAAVLTDRALRRRLIGVLGVSATLGDLLVANPAEWRELAGEQNTRAAGFSTRDVSTVPLLRSGYRRELLRIVAADLTAAADVEVTMRRLTELADATLQAALAIATAERGADECRLAVIAMGKCGGRELNYVSDVDVVFVAEPVEEGADVEKAMRAGSALAARMMEICGFVAWPVDAALRPEGSRGALVRTVASHLAYYKKWAKTWEFQALLKARPAAGDIALGEQWLAELQPLIWSAAERPEAVDEVRAMRRRIIEAIPRAEMDREIKRGPGGLRDIEFAVQLLQLVHGRADESLRTPTTLAGLRTLIEGGYVGLADGEALLRAYRFLRVVEHRLQLQRLRRTHTVPDDPAGLRWLAHALGYRPNAARDAVESFRTEWVRHAGEVRRLHAKLFYRPLLEAVARVPTEQLRLRPDAARARLDLLGFADPAGALRHIEALTGGVSRTAAIQRQLLPAMLSEFADAPEPDRGLLAYRQVSEKLGNTPWYLRLLRDEGPVALRLARLLALSRYVTDLLIHDPEALRLLADDTELQPRSAEILTEGFAAAAARHPDPETAINAVRALRRRELFRIACADLLGILDVTVVGDALSAVTDATLRATLGVTSAGAPDLAFAIIGMGRLGGSETSYPSDADVLFVCDGDAKTALTIAEELRRLLARPAHDPPLGVDADLRPEGRQGPLVRSLGAFEQYYARWSKVWEAQALLRARHVAGSPDLGARFLALADSKRYPQGGLTRDQVLEIRRLKARVDSERLPRGADPATHTKLGRGGLADVEWTVQLLQLQHGHAVAGLRTPRTLDALHAAVAAGLLDRMDAAELESAWRQASRVRNLLTLVRGRATDQIPRQGPDLAAAAAALNPGTEPQEFLDEYLRVARRARAVVERVFDGA
ncbi:bifunctional [glutamine synthetase] adenylyltransferase/[glutamine synthetase]-adenylyl-L-tyrosine phosphorylase [Dactylosporangium matsuzakiense]|uniref:Bifunctional glutamine synthetase adenylyltransferase/adenylyl-removing enzyme n=1 Tax=Dactylosporangium matsuzakiense TaxID=53360 RepID=A0A9W6KPA0_9ACTN|nr:bifunctional [glutamine synthetase] adenylyltransferase/[glutamine synthetase]-adenylyl-L-tyrosine phosphorylase [Dactylosporangium matsuzakiense]UWZ43497.1 bifunctional [glutamine synthetase] adenylyltransferase/[glutamine synthetase]-adenylyl-L-tyrosine phosphorylase [Dactylosporangium matsuzakiense]GLL02994.1 glutamate-ammonia-ligase adenylyltransferase [Dactylosporangium matsuzakiense]